VQIGMLGSLARLRGATEASWINVLATFVGLGVVFAAAAFKHRPPNLPLPFNNLPVFLLLGAAALLALAVSLRGVDAYLGVAGFFGFIYVVGASALAPRIGIALFACAITVGTLAGSVYLDHIGAFGADVQKLTLVKGIGLLALVLGVFLVRFGR
jgi:transporter family-2 protein